MAMRKYPQVASERPRPRVSRRPGCPAAEALVWGSSHTTLGGKGQPMKSAREEMEIVNAYAALGSYRAAAALCGTTHKTCAACSNGTTQARSGAGLLGPATRRP